MRLRIPHAGFSTVPSRYGKKAWTTPFLVPLRGKMASPNFSCGESTCTEKHFRTTFKYFWYRFSASTPLLEYWPRIGQLHITGFNDITAARKGQRSSLNFSRCPVRPQAPRYWELVTLFGSNQGPGDELESGWSSGYQRRSWSKTTTRQGHGCTGCRPLVSSPKNATRQILV